MPLYYLLVGRRMESVLGGPWASARFWPFDLWMCMTVRYHYAILPSFISYIYEWQDVTTCPACLGLGSASPKPSGARSAIQTSRTGSPTSTKIIYIYDEEKFKKKFIDFTTYIIWWFFKDDCINNWVSFLFKYMIEEKFQTFFLTNENIWWLWQPCILIFSLLVRLLDIFVYDLKMIQIF